MKRDSCTFKKLKFCFSLKKLKLELSFDPAVPPLGVYPEELKSGTENRCLYTNVLNSPGHNSPKLGTAQMGQQLMNR